MSFTIEQKYLLRLILTVFAIASAGCLAAATSHIFNALAHLVDVIPN